MATSDSDNFESADEDTEFRDAASKKSSPQWISRPPIDSDSDDNVCASPTVKHMSWSSEISNKKNKSQAYDVTKENTCKMKPNRGQDSPTSTKQTSVTTMKTEVEETKVESDDLNKTTKDTSISVENDTVALESKKSDDVKSASSAPDRRRVKTQKLPKSKESSKSMGLGAKKLGAKITSEPTATQSSSDNVSNYEEVKEEDSKMKKSNKVSDDWNLDDDKATEILRDSFNQSYEKSWMKIGNKSFGEIDKSVPEELKSDKKFKEIFRSDGWQDLENEDIIVTKLENKKENSLVLDEVTKVSEEKADSGGGWGSWGSWGVTSLLNTASAGVSTLTSHVTQGLSILEESINASDPVDSVPNEQDTEPVDTSNNETQELFGFSNLISGVSSITKLVESTGTRVITGGLSTLETIGKKTMEVLQEGDPGLKKKRAFFMNEMNKPILSQMLREAKDRAETEQKSIEEKQQARRVHFESLFDDFQGLVHLEALEMLSKQSNMKIQQRLVTLNSDQGMSLQETLDEVKELCDLGDEDDEEDSQDDELKEQLGIHFSELGVNTSFDKLYQIWEETKKYMDGVSSPESTVADREIFEKAILTLAQFTAFCVEQFHKTGELLLIKGNRSTVNEADALVQITKILSGQIGAIANLFSKCLNNRNKLFEKSDESVDVTTIFLEATNASSYVQDAFRLLIPILQVGVI